MTTVPLIDYEGLIETLEILADQDLASSIEQGLADAAAGRLVSHEDVWSDARDMVRVREARRAFREFHAQCFWYLRPDLQVSLDDVPEIVRGLRRNGGRRGFLVAARLCR